MKRNLIVLLSLLLSVVCSQAETRIKWHDIDSVIVNQKVDVNVSKVYLYAHSSAQPKNDHNIEKQNAAINDLPNVMEEGVKKVFRHATVIIIDDPSKASSDGLLIEAWLKNINWGSKALRTWSVGAGGMTGNYYVKVSNANGLVYEIINERYRSCTMSSAKGTAVIKAFNKAIVEDFIEATKELAEENK